MVIRLNNTQCWEHYGFIKWKQVSQYWEPLHSKLAGTILNCGGDWLESPLQCQSVHLRTGDESEFYRVWTPASLWLNFLYVPFYRESASRGSGLSTKEEHKSQLNYYSTHEIDFCEKNHRGKDESSPSYQTNKKTSSQTALWDEFPRRSPSRLTRR